MFQFVLGFSAGAALASFLIGSKYGVVHGAEAGMTPARAQVHRHLLANVHEPSKLEKAAGLFKRAGLNKQAAELASKAKQVHQQAAIAAEWVERARMNDQNAMASIAAVRDEAARGMPRAMVSAFLIERYINANPPPEPQHTAPEVGQAQEAVEGGAVVAADGAFAPGMAPPPEVPPNE